MDEKELSVLPAAESPAVPSVRHETELQNAALPRRRRPTDIAPDNSAADRKNLEKLHANADVFLELAAGTYLHRLVEKSFGNQFSPAALQAYRDRLLREAGDPIDPIEQLLIEQLLLAHHALGRLHMRASEATSPEAAKAYYGAASRLMGEVRRLALAIRTYRTPVQAKNFTVVRQQNIGQSQQIAQIDQAAPVNQPNDSSIGYCTKLVSNGNNGNMEHMNHAAESIVVAPPEAQSTAGASRPSQSPETRTPDARGA